MTPRDARRRLARRIRKTTQASPRGEAGGYFLATLDREARRRAGRLGGPTVFDLAENRSNRAVAGALDPSGGLLADLNAVCADAIGRSAGIQTERRRRPPMPAALIEAPAATSAGRFYDDREIMDALRITSRTTLTAAINRGELPEPIRLGNRNLWPAPVWDEFARTGKLPEKTTA